MSVAGTQHSEAAFFTMKSTTKISYCFDMRLGVGCLILFLMSSSCISWICPSQGPKVNHSFFRRRIFPVNSEKSGSEVC